MEKAYIPRWFRLYIRIYGTFHIVFGIPWILMAPAALILSIPILMVVAGASAFSEKRWGIAPIGILTFLIALFFVFIVIPFGSHEQEYHPVFVFGLLLGIEIYTSSMYWHYIVRRTDNAF